MSTEANLLEETFRKILARELGAGVSLYVTNEDKGNGEPRKIPAVVIAAARKGDNLNVTEAGRPASDMEVKFEARVDGTLVDSSATVEALTEQVRTAVRGATVDDFSDWHIMDAVEFTGTDHGFEGGTRLLASVFTMVTMPAV